MTRPTQYDQNGDRLTPAHLDLDDLDGTNIGTGIASSIPLIGGYDYATVEGMTARPVNRTASDFEDFVSQLHEYSEDVYRDKGAYGHRLWIPTTFNQSPEMDENDIPTGKMIFRARNIDARPTRLFGMDFDDAGNKFDDIWDVMEALECDYYMHTTMSYVPGVSDKCRVIIHVKDLINNNTENAEHFRALQNQFTPLGLVLDAACKNISRKFFVPSRNRKLGGFFRCEGNLERGALDMAAFLELERDRAWKQKIREDGEREARLAKMSLAALNRNHGVPYYYSPTDQNLIKQEHVIAFMSLPSRGSEMAAMAMRIVASCYRRFGAGAVSELMMAEALADMAGNTSHDNFEQSIRDAMRNFVPKS